jgi:LruC domain-containing protein
MKTLLKSTIFIAILAIITTSCKINEQPAPIETGGLNNISVPDGFTFETTEDIDITLKVTGDYSGKNIKFFIFNGNPDNGGSEVASGSVDGNGVYKTIISRSLMVDSVFISSNITGLGLGLIEVTGKSITHEFNMNSKLPQTGTSRNSFTDIISDFENGFDGWQPYRDNSIYTSEASNTPLSEGPAGSSDKFIWGFDTRGGVRAYLAPAKFSGDIYGQYIAYHYYLGNTVQSRPTANNIADIRITDGNNVLAIDLSSTFQHEVNAGWQTIYCKLDITENSGSGWRIGNMSHWTTGNGSRTLPGTAATDSQIQQILQNVTQMLIAPEYQVGYYSSNGPEFIALGKVGIISDVSTFPVIQQGQQIDDQDGDGVPDTNDDYPNDADKAYNNFGPGENEYGTLAYEDLWPDKGDYDFNDIVIDYNFNVITNASNKVVGMEGNFVLKATGAGFLDGFAFELPISQNKVTGVSGQLLSGSTFELSANGTESGQQNAVIALFDDSHVVFGESGFVNTDPSEDYIDPVEINITITFDGSFEITDLGSLPYNPFIVANQKRGYEIHLPGYQNTQLIDESLFGTAADNTNPGISKYYQTSSNLPWAIHIPVSFDYPVESNSIETAHLKFVEWAESGGSQYPDWYLEKSDYRNEGHIYQIPEKGN